MKHPNTKTKPQKVRAKAPKPKIDYPLEGERLEAPNYTLRISADGARAVRLSIDQGPWLDCRPSVGFWWFDWTPNAGGHEIVVCADYEGGREAVSETVRCLKG